VCDESVFVDPGHFLNLAICRRYQQALSSGEVGELLGESARQTQPNIQEVHCQDGAAGHGSSTSSLRTALRQDQEREDLAGDQKEGPLGFRRCGRSLQRNGHAQRSDCRTALRSRQVLQDFLQEHRRSPCRALEAIRLAIGSGKSHWLPRLAFEIFSGAGQLSKALGKLGFITIEFYIKLDPKFDLTPRKWQRMIRSITRAGVVFAIHIGTPCQSFLRARDRPGAPPPFVPMGFPSALLAQSLQIP